MQKETITTKCFSAGVRLQRYSEFSLIAKEVSEEATIAYLFWVGSIGAEGNRALARDSRIRNSGATRCVRISTNDSAIVVVVRQRTAVRDDRIQS